MRKENLLRPEWVLLHPADLLTYFQERFGGPGQTDSAVSGLNVFHLPMAGEACKVSLFLKGARITAIESGPALTDRERHDAAEEIERTLLSGTEEIGRDFGFSSYRVDGHWRGERSRVQIMPAPPAAPRPPVDMAEHPFVLEFPVQDCGRWSITNQRRRRVHRSLIRLLNLLLAGRTSCRPVRADHAWARLSDSDTSTWVEMIYFADFGQALQGANSPADSPPLEVLDREEYASVRGIDGRSLRIPADLDASIYGYFSLKSSDREPFDRALFWLDIAGRQWSHSMSSTFASLITAVEALLIQSEFHRIWCEECGRVAEHAAPSINASFKDFFETYAAGETRLSQRNKMYGVRSTIVHGGGLLLMDEDRGFGWHPVEEQEYQLLDGLWLLIQVAMRNWLQERIASGEKHADGI